MTSLILKFAFLVFPSVLILLHWRRRGVRSPLLYKLSWVEVGSYLLWLLFVAALGFVGSHPTFDWIRGGSIPANLFVFWPMLATMIALALCMFTLAAGKGERGFMVSSNLLMLVLWASSVVAPN
jgi:hypothetical protein